MRAALWPLLLLLGGVALAAEPLPSKPSDYVDDQAGLLSPSARADLARRLAAFERDTSNQVLVATFPTVPDGYAMEDFTQRTAEAWGVGQKAQDNGVVFFIFPKDRKMRIEVGYGLEGAIPDATAQAILARTVTPAFRRGDFEDGVTRGVDAILQAARGEYQGDGRTNADRTGGNSGAEDEPDASGTVLLICFGVIAIVFLLNTASRLRSGGWDYGPRGLRRHRSGWNAGGWSGGFGGGGGSGGGGGGFSGGGGSFGGGGASGGW